MKINIICGIQNPHKYKTNKNNTEKMQKTTQNNAILLTFYADYVMISEETSKNQMP